VQGIPGVRERQQQQQVHHQLQQQQMQVLTAPLAQELLTGHSPQHRAAPEPPSAQSANPQP
jgi:hypothetical protein